MPFIATAGPVTVAIEIVALLTPRYDIERLA